MSDPTHHHRREHVRTNPNTGEVIPVSESLVKNTGPRTGKKFAEVADQRDGLMGLVDSDDAFESSDWFAVGFDHEGHLPWAALGLSPEEAARWRDNGIDPLTLDEWDGSWFDVRIEPEDAKRFVDAGIDPSKAREWARFGFSAEDLPWAEQGFTAKDAARWRDSGISREEAIAWIAANIGPEEADKWKNIAGVATPEELMEWHAVAKLSPQEIAKAKYYGVTKPQDYIKHKKEQDDWLDVGVLYESSFDYKEVGLTTPQKFRESEARWEAAGVKFRWPISEWIRLVKPGYTEKDLAPFILGDMNLSPDVVREWQEENIPATDIEEFMKKGYTPKLALSEIKKGNNVKTAEDLRGNQPVPGKTWVEINDKLTTMASAKRFDISIESAWSKDGHKGDVDVTVRLTRPDDVPDYDYKGRHYYLKFTNTGEFVAASPERSDIRTDLDGEFTKAAFLEASELIHAIENRP
jgi:hypothetical protein